MLLTSSYKQAVFYIGKAGRTAVRCGLVGKRLILWNTHCQVYVWYEDRVRGVEKGKTHTIVVKTKKPKLVVFPLQFL